VHLVGFIIKKFVTMHGHMNVKKWNTADYNIILLVEFSPLYRRIGMSACLTARMYQISHLGYLLKFADKFRYWLDSVAVGQKQHILHGYLRKFMFSLHNWSVESKKTVCYQ
jgi:hypothetical protein